MPPVNLEEPRANLVPEVLAEKEAFSPRQIEKLRSALRIHRAYGSYGTGQRLTWVIIAGQIEADSDIELNAESLRQFVEGVSKRREPARQRTPQPPTLEAIKRYLMSPDIKALSEDEWQDHHDLTFQAPQRLALFLKQAFDREVQAPWKGLAGSYGARALIEDQPVTVRLDLKVSQDGDIVWVDETVDIYADGQYSVWEGRKEGRGWALVTPEDNILMFIKELPNNRNHYYLTTGIESDLYGGIGVRRFALLRHDYPLNIPMESTSNNSTRKLTLLQNDRDPSNIPKERVFDAKLTSDISRHTVAQMLLFSRLDMST